MLKMLKVFAVIVFFISSNATASNKIKDIDKVRKAIVTIDSRVPVSAYQTTGQWSGTGFIVDDNNGYLVTNNHVVGRASVGTYFITFHNGQQAEAKVVYYDMYVDFAILKVNPKDFPKEIERINFTSEMPKLGTDVFIVGNTEGQGFSFHNGYLSDLYEINGEMPQGSYVINMNSTGGASGSPVLNTDNQAVGVLYGGGKTHSLALKGSYVQHVLAELQSGKLTPTRNHIGVITTLYSLDKAVKHRGFDKDEMAKYISEFPDSRNRVIMIHSILPGATAENELKPGDILWEINGKKIAADLTILDLNMNSAKSNKIALTIIRNGKKIVKNINIYDIEKNKISRMLDFAGGLFFEADDFVASRSGIPIGSVALANVQTGGSFSSIPEMFTQDYKSVYRLWLKSLNGTAINNLSDLISATNKAITDKYINLEYRNFQPYYPSFGADRGFISAHKDLSQDITFDSIDTKPRILKFDKEKSEWVSEGI
jgi:S1-C subfamily serine protease